MGNVFSDEKDYTESERCFKEALYHCNILVEQGIEDSELMLAATLNSLAGIYHDTQQILLSDSLYNASLEIMGDPNICVMDTIQLNVYTKYNQLHHTSFRCCMPDQAND